MFAMTVYMMAQNAVGIKEIRHCDSVVADLTIAEWEMSEAFRRVAEVEVVRRG